MEKLDLNQKITVCNRCLQASCWLGKFMCDDSQTAGTVEKTVRELTELNLEYPVYWEEVLAAEQGYTLDEWREQSCTA